MKSIARQIPTITALCLSFAMMESVGHALPSVSVLMAAVGQTPTAEGQTKDQLMNLARQAQQQGDLRMAEWYSAQAAKVGAQPANSAGGLLQPLNAAGDKLRRGMDRLTQGRTLPQDRALQNRPQGGLFNNLFYQSKQSQNRQPASPQNLPTRALADKFLQKGREALAQGDLAAATGWYKHVQQTGVSFEGAAYTPQDLANELLQAGVRPASLAPATADPASPATLPMNFDNQAQRLASNPSAASQNPIPGTQIVTNPYAGVTSEPIPNGSPQQPSTITDQTIDIPSSGASQSVVEKAKQQALQLVAQSQLALSRGDLDTAHKLAEQAHKLNVPNGAFAPNEIRPWMVLLQINRARQAGNATQQNVVINPATPGPSVRPATDNTKSPRAARAVFDPTKDTTKVQPAAHEPPVLTLAQQAPIESGSSLLPEPATERTAQPESASTDEPAAEPAGYDLFRQGEQALKSSDINQARDFFKRAWAYEAELDPETRQRLQDHLQILRVPPSNPDRDDLAGIETTDELRRLATEIGREQSAVMRQLRNDPRAAWERIKALRDRVADADVDEVARQRLIARVERTMTNVDQFVERNRAKIERDERNQQMIAEIERRRRLKTEIGEKLAEIVVNFQELMDQRRYPEAVVLAKQARELEPQNPVVENMLWKSRTAERLMMELSLRESHENGTVMALQSVYNSSRPFNDLEPIVFPGAKVWEELTRDRRRLLQDDRSRYTEAELAIERALKTPVDVRFKDQPLSEVMDTLSQIVGVNVHLDPLGLAAEGVTSQTPVTIDLREPISLKSALTLILEPLQLSYVIQNEVLRVTSSQTSEANVVNQVYDVADLVIPIPNFIPSYNIGLPGAIREAHNAVGYGFPGGFRSAPLTVMAENDGAGSTNASVLAQMGSAGMLPTGGTRSPQPVGMGPGGLGGGANADFDTLIELITTTIAPTTWDLVGGPGSIAPFPTNLSLVVSQTQEVHEDIRDLLQQLRRLQDLQVTIEVRFITLNDNFFERIGVDFDFDIDNPIGSGKPATNRFLTGQDVVESSTGPRAVIGLDPVTGLPTADLDIVFSQGSFGATAPAFGGFDAGTAANFGFAILSDIEAFFIVEAAQGDTRTNILQAPKVTLFNGQQAFVSDTSQRPFVTSVIPVVGDFAAAHQPVIVVLSEGTSLSVQAVVSPDRRFVRLTLVPFFSQIGDIEEFTFDGARSSDSGTTEVDPTDDTQTVRDNASQVIEGTTVQLPTFSFTTVTTTVSVPDGGTILLGGIKRLSEGRNERGVPMLSKLPYINRLFKNVGIGRTTQSLMMMVTPRIIIQEEEEEKLGISLPTN